MKVTLRLFASLSIYLPVAARSRHQIELEVAPGTTVLDLIQGQGIPPDTCAIALVDGVWVARAERAVRVLSEGEALALWPPVAGG